MEKDFDLLDFNSAEKEEAPVEIEAAPEEGAKKIRSPKAMLLHMSTKQTKIIAAICIILAILIAGITTCAVNDINPISYMASIITNDKAHLVAKWQSQEAPGVSAYVFNDDGTYDSYLSSFKFPGEYDTKGDRLILKKPDTNTSVEYKYSVRGDVLTMTLYKESGHKVKDKKTYKYDRVDALNQKTFGDLLNANSDTTKPAE